MANLCECGLIRGSSGRCPNKACKHDSTPTAMNLAPMVVYSSKDTVQWLPVFPGDVPEFLKEPEVMGQLVKGYMAKAPQDDIWYRAERHAE